MKLIIKYDIASEEINKRKNVRQQKLHGEKHKRKNETPACLTSI
jgi:hypothetical protein